MKNVYLAYTLYFCLGIFIASGINFAIAQITTSTTERINEIDQVIKIKTELEKPIDTTTSRFILQKAQRDYTLKYLYEISK